MMRTPRFDWEAHKEQLLELKYQQKKSLTEICRLLYEKAGVSYTAARLSQVFSQWKKTEEVNPPIREDYTNAH